MTFTSVDLHSEGDNKRLPIHYAAMTKPHKATGKEVRTEERDSTSCHLHSEPYGSIMYLPVYLFTITFDTNIHTKTFIQP